MLGIPSYMTKHFAQTQYYKTLQPSNTQYDSVVAFLLAVQPSYSKVVVLILSSPHTPLSPHSIII